MWRGKLLRSWRKECAGVWLGVKVLMVSGAESICIICKIWWICQNLFLTYFAYLQFSGEHDCLVPVTPYLAGVFNYLRLHRKIPPKVRAVDMRHILLLLPFLLDGLLADEVLEHNRLRPLNPALDPSSELVGITLIFIQWYNLYRRRYQPKDEVDIQDLATLGDRCEHIKHILHIVYLKHIVHILGTWNNVKSCFHLSMDMVIQSWPLKRITVFDIPLEMLHDIMMLSM